ncbi:MAG: hypothetical protein A3J46_02835 [Candidatus Yanofskybacteria bacterium RIFCSPHIGHO2_02_FULL_41_11]|uniref:Toprim domain-containing protein n=1 Tax=Candidatus Yanofskybacteria bacterium RIFCSPHIGHO2_02_FULL_41_11 TaxID=1802675 RepID=A0A1F8F638_9BACT|nr:MAG: hypothetical protein A3J46_02835 [Candidatus Yanofskybacteria bacterium RIFCSPHIGHO2_02_FULL_41_11]
MQEDLFGIFKPVGLADINSLPNPSFRDWAQRRFKEGTLNDVLVGLVRTGVAVDTKEALKLLGIRSVTTRLPEKASLITLTDLGLNPVKKFNISAYPLYQKGEINLQRYLGGLSHALMVNFCRMQSSTSGTLKTTNFQLPLFDYECREAEQPELVGLSEATDNINEDDLISALKRVWSEISETMKAPDFIEGYYRSAKHLETFLNLTQVYTGVIFRQEFYKTDIFGRWLWLNAMLTWANAFINLTEGNLPCPTIHEIRVCNRDLGISGGRIDGVEILSENKVFSGSVNDTKLASIGQIAKCLGGKPGACGALRVIDWKFAIGDMIKNKDSAKRPISPEAVSKSPFEKHRRQIERYLTLGFLDERFACKTNFNESDHFWNERTAIEEGLIVYLFPTSPPTIHRVSLTAEERRKVFVRDIASCWDEAGRQALIRQIDSRCRSLFSSRRETHDKTAGQSCLPDQDPNCSLPIVSVVNRHRVFVDKDNIIEDRNGKYVLHLDRLISCMESGTLKASSAFTLPRGGLVCCPVHEDKRPSLSVRPLDGFFYCFARSCKISGRLLLNSMPREIQAVISPESWVKRKELFKDLFIPDEHHNVLKQTQLLLQEQFYESNGERYIREERGIDPDLAYEMGAGFGNSDVISVILDQGISLEELATVGLVRFSSRISSGRGLCPLLRRRGMSLGEIKKEIGRTAGDKTLYGFPYFALEGRVTFPLKVKMKYTNIYGRSVFPNAKVPHIKLSSENSGIRHGAFNEEIIYSEKCGEVVVVEGVFDALSLKQMFLLDSLAVIGTKNNLIAELMAQSGKNVAIALDNDHGGREDAVRLKKALLQSSKFKGKVRDFTQSFISGLYGRELEVRHRGLSDWRDTLDWDDWNTLLLRHGKWLS